MTTQRRLLRLTIRDVLKEYGIDDLAMEMEIATAVINVLSGNKPNKKWTSDKVRAGAAKALEEGTEREDTIKGDFYKHFHINIDWDKKQSKDLLAFLMERPKGETIDRFAAWWDTEDWRGKDGAPPSLFQVWTLWPQAFKDDQVIDFINID